MPKRTSKNDIRDLLIEAYDPSYYASLYRQMCYAMGDKWRARLPGVSDGEFPYFPDIKVEFLEIGQSRRILNAAFHSLSRTMYADPSPDFPDQDKYTAEVLRQFFRRRFQGHYGRWSWRGHARACFMEGDGLGIGFCEVGAITNPETDKQRVHVQHSPTVQTLWDRHAKEPEELRFICFVKYLPVQEARALYGEKVDEYVRDTWEWMGGRSFKTVRVFEYWDLGIGGSKSTHAIIPGDWGSEPLVYEDNPFDCLPFFHYQHFRAPGQRRPIGRIALQMTTHEVLNLMERHLKAVLKRPGFQVVDALKLNTDDLKAVAAGRLDMMVRWEGNTPGITQPPVIPVPSAQLAQDSLVIQQWYERQYNDDSGTTDFDRGTMSAQSRTLGENLLADQRSQQNSAWSQNEAAQMCVRMVHRTLHIAKLVDRDPVDIDFFGHLLKLNDPTQPQSFVSNMFDNVGQVLVSEDDLRRQDRQQEGALRLQSLSALMPLVQAGQINLQKYTEEVLKALGEKDPQEWMP